MRFRLLGPTEVLGPDGPVPLGGPKQRSVLAMLALSANRVVASERLIAGVWGEDASEKSSATLQVYISSLRKALKDVDGATIVSRRPGYLLEVDADDVDVHRFDTLAAQGRDHLVAARPPDASRALHAALALWRGPALADLRDEPFAGPDVVRLDQARLAATEDRIDADLAAGLHRDLVGELETLVGANPLRERMWGQLMVALYRSDRQADAIAAYARARTILAEELGIDPGPALRELERAVLAQDLEGAAARPAHTPAVVRIPRPSGRLVGRHDELARLADVLSDADERLISLTGPGGSGKTRLALELAQQCAESFRGGVYFVDLSAVTDPALVLAEIAGVLGADDGTVESLAEALHDRDVLLVLDNVEHLLAATDDLTALLRAASRLRMVVTSRVALRVAGEIEHLVDGLALPAPDADVVAVGASAAVQLFVARAKAIRSDFALRPENSALVADICRRLDGLPLAIELAAARLRLLSLDAITARLDQSLTLLTAGHRNAPERQRTMRATIRWSVDLLDDAEQAVLGAIGLFAGSFDLDAALAVCGDDAEEHLDALLGSSLLRADGDRFRLLESVRQFARDELEAPTADAFVAHFRDRAVSIGAAADGPQAIAAADRVEADYGNFRAALQSAIARGDLTTAAQFAVALSPSWLTLGRVGEARLQLAEVIAAGCDDPAVYAVAGRLAYQQGDIAEAMRLIDIALGADKPLDPETSAVTRGLRAAMALGSGDLEVAHAEAEDVLALDVYAGQVVALSVLAIAAAMGGDFATEREHYERRLVLARQHGDRVRIADTLTTLGEIAFDEGDYSAAAASVREAFELADQHIRPESRDALIMLGRIAVAEREPERAFGLLDQSLQRAVEIGAPVALALCIRVHAAAAVVTGDAVRAARLFGAGAAMHPSSTPSNPATEQDLGARRDECRALLGDAAFEREVAAGAAMGVDDVLALANSRQWSVSASVVSYN